jgi:large subunit ribosomal protein L10
MALTKSRKKEMLQELQSTISDSQGMVFTDFQGSGVSALQTLRTQLRVENARYKVVKKTLFNKALQNLGFEVSLAEQLPGNLGVVFAGDPVFGAKVVNDFAKKAPKDTFTLLGGLLDGQYLVAEQVTTLAKLPAKEVLQAQVVGTLAAPMTQFLQVTSGVSRGLVTVISAYRDTK